MPKIIAMFDVAEEDVDADDPTGLTEEAHSRYIDALIGQGAENIEFRPR